MAVLEETTKLPELKAPVTAPNFQDFASEAKKLGLETFGAYRDVMSRTYKDEASALQRKLVGQNVAPESTLGALNVQKFLDARSQQLEPVGRQIAGETALKALSYQYDIAGEERAKELEAQIDARERAQELETININQSYQKEVAATNRLQELEDLKNKQGYDAEIYAKKRTDLLADIQEQRTYQQAVKDKQNLDLAGTNPNTGTRFANIAELEAYANTQGMSAQEYVKDVEFKKDQAYKQKLNDAEFTRMYGVGENGEVFNSKFEAETYWEQKGYDKDLIQDAGLNPSTNTPFKNKAELDAYAKTQGLSSEQYIAKVAEDKRLEAEAKDITQTYGETDLDGKAITTVAQGEANNRKLLIIDSVGKKQDGTLFNNIAEGNKYWRDLDYDTGLLEEAGMDPNTYKKDADGNIDYTTGKPFLNRAALDTYAQSKNMTTDEYIADVKEQKLFKKSMDQYGDQIPLDKKAQIKNMVQLQFYRDNGITYQEHAAEIAAIAKSKEDWAKLKEPVNILISEMERVKTGAGFDNDQTAAYLDLLAVRDTILAGEIPIMSGGYVDKVLSRFEEKGLTDELQSVYTQAGFGTVRDTATALAKVATDRENYMKNFAGGGG